jgi:insulysin
MHTIKKPLVDNRDYRYVELDNKMKVILISDPESQKSAASLNVGVGSFSDPDDFPGLAHFLEHMLFMGTKKYPDENYFEAKLDALGGSYNAYTDSENTVYHYEVLNDGFEEILDIFSKFFIDPLMKKDSVDREINAVDSENTKNLENDLWRVTQLLCSLAKPNHPAHKFGTGNLETLKKYNIREVLLDFHKKYYSSNIMHLTILTNKDLDYCEKIARNYFKDVINKNVSISYSTNELPYSAEYGLNKTYYVKPVQNVNQIKLVWQFPYQMPFYKNKSLSIISSLLGDENPGSIYNHLKNKGWINSLTSGTTNESYNFNIFELNIDLTLEGLNNIDEIVSTVYEYIKILRANEDWESFFKEQQQSSDIRFNYSDKMGAENFTVNVCNALENYDVEDVLYGAYRHNSIDIDQLNGLIDLLTPENMITLVIRATTNDKRKNLKEKYYGTEYHQIENPTIGKKSHNLPLALPPKNIYLPEDLKLKNHVNSDTPSEIISRNQGIKVWNCFNNKFKTPKAMYWIQIISPNFFKNVEDHILTELLCDMWDDYVNPQLYNASLINYTYNFSNDPTSNSIGVYCSGYNNKLNEVVKTVLKTITNFEDKFDQIKFNVVKQKLKQNLDNIKLGSPWSLISYNLKDKWIKNFSNYNKLLEKIDLVTFDDIKKHYYNLFDNVNVKVVTVGNILQNEIIDVQQFFDTAADLSKYDHLIKTDPVFGIYDYKNYNSKDENEAVGMYYQVFNDNYDYNLVSKLYLLGTLIKEPFFDQLRTKEQLGYLVTSSVYSIIDSYGLIFMIQSPVQNSKYLAERITLFLNEFKSKLESYSDFEIQKNSLIMELSEPDKRIGQLGSRIIREISNEKYEYDRKEKIIKIITELNLTDIISFFKEYVLNNKNSIEIHNMKK